MKKKMMIAMCMVLVAVVCVMKFSAVKAANLYKNYDEFKQAFESAPTYQDKIKVLENLDEFNNADVTTSYIVNHNADFTSQVKRLLDALLTADPKDVPDIIKTIQKIIDILVLEGYYNQAVKTRIPKNEKFLMEIFADESYYIAALKVLAADKKNKDLLNKLVFDTKILNPADANLAEFIMTQYIRDTESEENNNAIYILSDAWKYATPNQKNHKFTVNDDDVYAIISWNKGDKKGVLDFIADIGTGIANTLKNGQKISDIFAVNVGILPVDASSIEELGKGLHDVAK